MGFVTAVHESSNNMSLRLDELYCEYDDIPLFNPITMSLHRGDIVHVRGENGRGKTTLMRTISGLRTPASGRVFWNEVNIYQQERREYQPCYIGHLNGLNHRLTVRENLHYLTMGLSIHASIDEAIAVMRLNQQADILVAELSSGQQRRAILAKLFIMESSLWLLDEPFVALDDSAVSCLSRAMTAFSQGGGMVLLTSHQRLPLHKSGYREYQLL